MREILFRGKRIDNGEWVVGIPWIFAPPVNKAVIVYAMGLVGEDDDTSRYCECHEVDPSTIGQYTGLTDKNGKKIFEGDILKAVHYFHGSRDEFEKKKIRKAYGKAIGNKDSYLEELTYFRNYVVEYSAKKCAWIGRNGSDQHELTSLTNLFHNGTVIGSVHDNPELLEDKP